MAGTKPASDSSSHFRAEVAADQAGRTLSEVVRSMLPAGSWNYARELCKRGKVRRNGALASDAAQRLQAGDFIEIDLHARRRREHRLDECALVHVDNEIVVVNKPAGLMSVPFDPSDRDTLVDRLQFLLRRGPGARRGELGVVHRLDKDTTGLLVFTRTLAAKRALQQLFRRHALVRRYLAIAHGDVSAQRIESDLIADRGDGLRGSFGLFRRARGPLPHSAQHAISEVRPLEALRGATLIECSLQTGRTHQIRIHLSERDHPLVGEPLYIRDYRGPRIAAPRPMLHAAELGFAHPRTQQPLHFRQEPPPDFTELLVSLRAEA